MSDDKGFFFFVRYLVVLVVLQEGVQLLQHGYICGVVYITFFVNQPQKTVGLALKVVSNV